MSASSVASAASPPGSSQIVSTRSLLRGIAPSMVTTRPNAMSSHVKDGDGDYRPLTASPAARSSPAGHTNLSMLKTRLSVSRCQATPIAPADAAPFAMRDGSPFTGGCGRIRNAQILIFGTKRAALIALAVGLFKVGRIEGAIR